MHPKDLCAVYSNFIITGIYYEDLYHTTKYLPSYVLPAGFPSSDQLTNDLPSPTSISSRQQQIDRRQRPNTRRPRYVSTGLDQPEPVERSASDSTHDLPLPATTPGEVGTNPGKPEYIEIPKPSRTSNASVRGLGSMVTLGEADLMPARDPPQYSFFDLFPFSLLVKYLTKRGRKLKGKKAALLRAKLHHRSVTQNLPLEISLYIVRFHPDGAVCLFSERHHRARTLPHCKAAKLSMQRLLVCALFGAELNKLTNSSCRPANLIAALNQLVDALTGLERILTTPLPYSSVTSCS